MCPHGGECTLVLKLMKLWGAWVPQSIKRSTLSFGSGHGLGVVRWSPMSGSVLGEMSA